MSANPLLQAYDLPPFSSIRPEHVKPAIERILADNRAAIARLLETQREQPTWKGLVLAMDELNEDYTEEEIRLVRIQFISEMAN